MPAGVEDPSLRLRAPAGQFPAADLDPASANGSANTAMNNALRRPLMASRSTAEWSSSRSRNVCETGLAAAVLQLGSESISKIGPLCLILLLARGPSPLWHPRPRAHCGAFAAGLLPSAPARAPVRPPSPPKPRQVSPGRVAEGSWLTRLSVHLPRPAARTEAAFGVGTLTPSRSRSGRPLPTGSTPAAGLARLRSRRLPLPAALPLWTHLSRRRHPPRLTAGSTRAPLSQREAEAQGAQRYARGVILAPVSLNSGHDRWSYTSP